MTTILYPEALYPDDREERRILGRMRTSCFGRLIVTPHSAFFTPEAWDDIRTKSAETICAALLGPRPQNVITPEMF